MRVSQRGVKSASVRQAKLRTLWIVTLSPSISAHGACATSGVQARSAGGCRLPNQTSTPRRRRPRPGRPARRRRREQHGRPPPRRQQRHADGERASRTAPASLPATRNASTAQPPRPATARSNGKRPNAQQSITCPSSTQHIHVCDHTLRHSATSRISLGQVVSMQVDMAGRATEMTNDNGRCGTPACASGPCLIDPLRRTRCRLSRRCHGEPPWVRLRAIGLVALPRLCARGAGRRCRVCASGRPSRSASSC